MTKIFLFPFLIALLSNSLACPNQSKLNKRTLGKNNLISTTDFYGSELSDSKIYAYDEPLSSLEDKPMNNGNVSTISSSNDENYILKNINYSNSQEVNATYTNSNCFVRKPVYKDYSYYDKVQVGDILIETKCQNFLLTNVVNNPGHVALVVEKNASSSYGNYIKTIEVVGGGVQFGFLDADIFIYFGVEIYRPYLDYYGSIDTAIDFAKSQLGKPYSFDPKRTQTSPDSTKWYCSELVYAAYLSALVRVGDINSSGSVMPYDILYCSNLYLVPFYYFVDIRINRYYGNKDGYYLEVFNATNEEIILFYNSKMCYFRDAAYWTNLKDVKNIRMKPNSSINVCISTNWFADAFAFSITRGNKRLITSGSEVRSGSCYMATFKMERNL